MRILFLAPVVLAGCAPSDDDTLNSMTAPNDPQVEAYLYETCLTLARGPQSTHYNDLDEMVTECGAQASYKSAFCPTNRRCQSNLLSRADVRTILPNQEQPK